MSECQLSRVKPWSSLVEGDGGSYLLNRQSNLVISFHALSVLFCILINTTAYHSTDMSLHLPLAVALSGQMVQTCK